MAIQINVEKGIFDISEKGSFIHSLPEITNWPIYNIKKGFTVERAFVRGSFFRQFLPQDTWKGLAASGGWPAYG